jgi:hypothetical protein
MFTGERLHDSLSHGRLLGSWDADRAAAGWKHIGFMSGAMHKQTGKNIKSLSAQVGSMLYMEKSQAD